MADQAPSAETAQPVANAQEAPVADSIQEESPVIESFPADEEEVAKEEAPAFKQAYTAPQRFNSKPAYQAPTYNRSAAPRTPAPMDTPRTTTTRSVGFQSRFGPAAPAQPQQDTYHEEERPARYEAPRPAYPAARPPYNNEGSRFQQRPASSPIFPLQSSLRPQQQFCIQRG